MMDFTKQPLPKWVDIPADKYDIQLRDIKYDKRFTLRTEKPTGFETKYQMYLRSQHWLLFRRVVLMLANFKCAGEGCKNEAREVHHLNYKRVGKELLSDVEPLCGKCHGLRHGITDAPETAYGNSISLHDATLKVMKKLMAGKPTPLAAERKRA